MSTSLTEFMEEKSPRRVFPREERLKSRADIHSVFKKGRCAALRDAKLFYLRNDRAYNRIAFTFARKFGNAVERNRARRLGRESYRHLRGALPPGWDLVLLVYPGESTFSKRFAQLQALVRRAQWK
jgi:ribonuclease P protein component